jgi:type IV secretion system protein VirB11
MNAQAQDIPTYLDAYLRPLAPWLDQDDVTDILINAPGEVWVERLGVGMARHLVPDLTDQALWRLVTQIAAADHQGVSRQHPLLAASLPTGARVQVVAPPATRGAMAIAIRKPAVARMALQDFDVGLRDAGSAIASQADLDLQARLAAGDVSGFLRGAVRARKNIVISGGTSTGKTTFLNALVQEIPREERLVLIEDTAEVRCPQANMVGLLAARGGQGEAHVDVNDLLQASLRLRPDRIILGELRGAEAFSFLRAVNSGHPGSITTVHADSPRGALDQIALMVLQAGANLGRGEIVDYVQGVVDVAVQLTRTEGRRTISEVMFRSPLASQAWRT